MQISAIPIDSEFAISEKTHKLTILSENKNNQAPTQKNTILI